MRRYRWLFSLLLFLQFQQDIRVVAAEAEAEAEATRTTTPPDLLFWFDDDDTPASTSDDDDDDRVMVDENASCTCQLPKDTSLCRVGFVESCKSAVCYGSDALCEALDPDQKGFLGLCYVQEGLFQAQKCHCIGMFCPSHPQDCYHDNTAIIRITDPVRGDCEAGGCCQPNLPLCELERIFFFLSLGYGITTDSWSTKCSSSSFDALGSNHGCTYRTNGRSNGVAICSNANITMDDEDEGRKYCDVAFSGTNNLLNLVQEALLVTRVVGRDVSFVSSSSDHSHNINVSFVVVDFMADIAFGTDGIVDIALQEAEAKGCFSRATDNSGGGGGIHLMGHSLGAVMANLFALKLSVLFPHVHVRMTTVGEPAMLLEPLAGHAAELQAWSNKARYINGRVLPREPVLPLLDTKPRKYGIYQDYCPIAQALPGGYPAGNKNTKELFLCETLQPNGTLRYYFGPSGEGCAFGRNDVLNDFPSFPHKGGLERIENGEDGDFGDKLEQMKEFLQMMGGFQFLDDIIATLNVATSISDPDYRDAFLQLGDLHSLRRSLLFLNALYSQGEQCDATTRRVPIAKDACPMPGEQESLSSSSLSSAPSSYLTSTTAVIQNSTGTTTSIVPSWTAMSDQSILAQNGTSTQLSLPTTQDAHISNEANDISGFDRDMGKLSKANLLVFISTVLLLLQGT
jgi:hypothetical protein